MDPLISVIVPTHNRPRLLLDRALPSIFGQRYPRLEILVVGDGTDEFTQQQMETYPDDRLRFWNLPKQVLPEDPGRAWCLLGLEARNFALDQAQGDYIAPLDDDDAWADGHLVKLLSAINDTGADYAYGRSIAHWADGRTSWYGQWPPQHFSHCDGSQLYRNGMGYRYDPACVDRGLPEDGDLIDRMVAGGVKFSFVNEVVHIYYPNPR